MDNTQILIFITTALVLVSGLMKFGFDIVLDGFIMSVGLLLGEIVGYMIHSL